MTPNDTALVPSSPFAAVGVLFIDPAQSALRELLEQAHEVIVRFPELLERVDADLDAHALDKKALRVADGRWRARQGESLPGLHCAAEPLDPGSLLLEVGRPRTPAYAVLMALFLRGYQGEGFKARDTRSLQAESITLRTMFANMGVRQPQPGTLTELVNAVSVDTREWVLTAQLAYALELELDDFKTMIADSTHVRGNTAWPTDSRLMVAICERLLHVGASLPELGLSAIEAGRAAKQVLTMRELDRQIDLSTGKQRQGRPRRRAYAKMIRRSHKVQQQLAGPIAAAQAQLDGLDMAPSRRLLAQRAVAQLQADLATLTAVTDNCQSRVLNGERVPMCDKVLSVSDPDAAYIAKGQREAVIGYKPQIARSRHGFVTSLKLPRGNAADSAQLLDLADDTTTRTGVKLRVVSVDDGYASAANVTALTKRNINVVAINGAKGKKLTSDEQWHSDEHAQARNLRSAVESLMYTIKQGFNFDEVARRGLDAVHAELLEKVLAHNLCNLIRVRNHKQRQTPALAA